jgi:hypothetical protein
VYLRSSGCLRDKIGAASLQRPGTGKNPKQATTYRAISAHCSQLLLLKFSGFDRLVELKSNNLKGNHALCEDRKCKRLCSNYEEDKKCDDIISRFKY